MPYLAHSAHLQLVGLWVGCVGWILTAVALGLVQWRVWHVLDVTVITSGVAWVGIWRTCFYSRVLLTSDSQDMFCQAMGLLDSFAPPEIPTAQVLMMLALVAGLGGNASAVYGLRCVYFGLEERQPIRTAFSLAGALSMLAGGCSLLPLSWNLNSVVANHSISFPAHFHMPDAPVRQEAGAGIGVGITASILLIGSGLMFLSYRFPASPKVSPSPDLSSIGTSGLQECSAVSLHSRDNPAFESQESLQDSGPNAHPVS
ncbi:claudin-34 [Megalops cyprinoides]|uniref:claudin-34 n=1 Tax=Megalops cyprinoides TaxID=118141 RepID=UPI001863C0D2|nr:claudin-34 [Megalops cyprinoides]